MITIKTKSKGKEQLFANDLKKNKDIEVNIVEAAQDVDLSKPGVGALGWILILDDNNPITKKLAAALGVKDGWKLTKAGDIFAAYNAGDRLTIFEKSQDYDSDD